MFCKIVWNQVYFNTLYTSHEPAFRVLIWSPCMILAMSCFYIRTCVHSFSKDLFCSRLCFSCHIYPRLLSQQITTYTGQKNTDFEILMTFHVKISRAIMLLIMVAQVNSKTKGLIVYGSSSHFEHNVIRNFVIRVFGLLSPE
ncbi:hypothetical protein NC652_039323 [Populus alba x Populus x berolinensis]|nr:hypothetical protein NC652_039323 [Populus alba x Populus x berolinensis]